MGKSRPRSPLSYARKQKARGDSQTHHCTSWDPWCAVHYSVNVPFGWGYTVTWSSPGAVLQQCEATSNAPFTLLTDAWILVVVGVARPSWLTLSFCFGAKCVRAAQSSVGLSRLIFRRESMLTRLATYDATTVCSRRSYWWVTLDIVCHRRWLTLAKDWLFRLIINVDGGGDATISMKPWSKIVNLS